MSEKLTNYKNNKKKPELLAPAGNIESFYGVLRAGADAVYLAGSKFGARAYADNFTEEQLLTCIRYAHLYGKKVYITVNTLVKDSEISEIIPFIEPLYNAGLDGVIIQDIGVFRLLSEKFPLLELHASTQMAITGTKGALFAKELGACRVVPARELSLNEIIEIKNSTGLQLECFVHGAMCYSYSGQCLFSSVIGKRSGNRGRCAQPCRLPYSTKNLPKKEIYPLSLKDMCTIDLLPELIKAGIDSFKIEGRMKKPEYAAGVTSIYRKYIDEFFSTGLIKVTKEDRNLLENLYIRSEISEGYYHRYNGKDMVTYSSPSYNGASDSLLDAIRQKYLGDKPLFDLKKKEISFSASFVTDEKAVVNACFDDICVTVTGDTVDRAKNRAITSDDVAKQLGKLGDTVFCTEFSDISNLIYVSEDAYYPLKGINELRREAVNRLENIILDKALTARKENSDLALRIRNNSDSAVRKDNNFKSHNHYFSVLVTDIAQLKSLMSYANNVLNSNLLCRIYIPEELFFTEIMTAGGKILSKEILSELSCLKDIEIYIACPYIRRLNDNVYLKGVEYLLNTHNDFIKGILVRNWEDYKWFYDIYSDNAAVKCAADFGLYAWNNYSVDVLSEHASFVGMPLELNSHDQNSLRNSNEDIYFEKMIYGRYPLMQSANCIRKTTDVCLKAKIQKDSSDFYNEYSSHKFISIKDRTGRYIPVYNDCLHCRNTVFNSVPLSLKNDVLNKYKNVIFRIEFTNEDVSFVSQILDYYLSGKGEPEWEHTGGFEKQSTE